MHGGLKNLCLYATSRQGVNKKIVSYFFTAVPENLVLVNFFFSLTSAVVCIEDVRFVRRLVRIAAGRVGQDPAVFPEFLGYGRAAVACAVRSI